tara:strand:+ start:42460 stop:42798 length:339 start_codon:yes stop_codon:yes gene_type:complete
MSEQDLKLTEFRRAWMDADGHYVDDIRDANGDGSLIQAIEYNWWRHQANWSMAATAALEKTNPTIATLLQSATDLNNKIKDGREKAEHIVKIVGKSAKIAEALGKLLKAVAQ